MRVCYSDLHLQVSQRTSGAILREVKLVGHRSNTLEREYSSRITIHANEKRSAIMADRCHQTLPILGNTAVLTYANLLPHAQRQNHICGFCVLPPHRIVELLQQY